jgi:biotin synthase
MARYLIYNDFIMNINFDDKGRITGFGFRLEELKNKIQPIAFQTSGCPGCNRPYYNERPSGVMYNYPYEPSKEEHKKALKNAMAGLG